MFSTTMTEKQKSLSALCLEAAFTCLPF